MALQLNLPAGKTFQGAPAPEAYARIVALSFDARNGEVAVSVDIFHSSQARLDAKAPVAGGVYRGIVGEDVPNLDDKIDGVRAVLYAWLKTLPDFEGAIDV